MNTEVIETEKESFNWDRHWFSEQQIMDAPIESKIEKLMTLTSTAAVNTAFEKFIDDWLIEALEESGVTVLEENEVD